MVAEIEAQGRDDGQVMDELVDMTSEVCDKAVSMKTVQAMVSAMAEERDRETRRGISECYTPARASTTKAVKKVHIRAGKVVQAARMRDLLASMGVTIKKDAKGKKW